MKGIDQLSDNFLGFGELYFSTVEEGYIKGWKRHVKVTCNLIVPVGEVKFVWFEENGNPKSIVIGERNYRLLCIPPNVWFGFQGIKPTNVIANIIDQVHDPLESQTKNLDLFTNDWGPND